MQNREARTTMPTMAGLALLLCASIAVADTVDDYIHAEMERQRIPGLALGVILDGEIVKTQGYGFGNVELRVPVTSDSVFRISSISKQFLATAVMLLVADGTMTLEDKIDKYLKDAPDSWGPISVRNLLTHTSGLRAESPGFDGLAATPNAQLVRNAYSSPVLFKPGEQFAYSNLGYYVLAEVIEEAGGKPWPELLSERIFAPLEMTATRTTDVIDIVPNRADGYVFRDNTLRNARPLITLRASGALLSTLSDLMKWDAALTAHRLVAPSMQDVMWAAVTLPNGSSTKYGFGWWIDDVGGHRRIRHGGDNPGYASEFSRFVTDRLDIIVLTNGGCSRPDAIAREVASRFVPELSPPRPTIQLDNGVLANYAGRYQFASDDIVTIDVDGDGLSVQGTAPALSQCKLLAESPTTFFISKDESYVFSIEEGRVTKMIVQSGNQEFTAAKVD